MRPFQLFCIKVDRIVGISGRKKINTKSSKFILYEKYFTDFHFSEFSFRLWMHPGLEIYASMLLVISNSLITHIYV